MNFVPPPSGDRNTYSEKPVKTQSDNCGTTDFFSPPIQSAPLKTPCWPLYDEPDNRPALPLYDLRTREPERRARLWRCAGKTVYGHRIEPAADPEICERVLRAFADASRRPARRKRRGRTEQSSSTGKAFFRHAAKRAWKPPPKRIGAFSAWDDSPSESFAVKPQDEMAELVSAYLLGGGRITYRAAYTYNRRRICIAMKSTLTLRLDGYGTWRVEKIDNDLAETVAHFVDFQQAQRFALHAARLWGFEYDAAVKPPPKPIKREPVIAL